MTRPPSAAAAPTPRLRSDLAGLPSYRAGRRPVGPGPRYSLASNESPFPPSEAVLAAIADAARTAHRYPDPGSGVLLTALAGAYGLPRDRFAVGTGSVALCQQLASAAAGPGDEIIFAWRSFEAYPIVTGIAGARAVTVPLTGDACHDLSSMADAVTPRTRLVFLCTPNNPTGPVLSGAEVASFLDALPPQLLVVVDEAYREFVTAPGAVDGAELAVARRNVVTLRTLSKAYGLAGLRVGYAIGDPAVIDRVRAVGVPFGVSRIAEAAGAAVLREDDLVQDRAARTVAERERVVTALRGAGWQVPQAQGNFVWLPLGGAAEAFAAACTERGFTVRAFPGEGVRVTVAEPAANDLFVQTALDWQEDR